MKRHHVIALSVLSALLAAAVPAFGQSRATPPAIAPAAPAYVDLELILAVDVSGSMDGIEQRFQRAGYLAAIPHPDVIRAIRSGPNRRIALTYIEWAGDEAQSITVPWQIISGEASAKAFADRLSRARVAYLRGTSIANILEFGSKYFDKSGVTGLKRVIDVSGDGPNNEGWPITKVRDEVLAKGIVINGLPIMLEPVYGMPFGLDQYYRDCVIGGPGSFVLPLLRSEDWAKAIRRKLVLEIAGRPAKLVRTELKPIVPGARKSQTDCKIGEKLRSRWDH